jgi:hypothetical protein
VLQETTEQQFIAPNTQPQVLAVLHVVLVHARTIQCGSGLVTLHLGFSNLFLLFCFLCCIGSSFGYTALSWPQAAVSSACNCAGPVEVKNALTKLSGVRLTPGEMHRSLIYWHVCLHL